jgi:hypothetical protein
MTAPRRSPTRSAKSVTVDNLMRRALRVSDPDDPVQVADGLLARYPEIADRIERERLGLNRRSIAEPKLADGGLAGASGAEVAQAKDDLERDLATLLHASELKDIAVELKGWGRAVRKAAAEGLAAAPLALDIVQNDKAMAARRMSATVRTACWIGVVQRPPKRRHAPAGTACVELPAGSGGRLHDLPRASPQRGDARRRT